MPSIKACFYRCVAVLCVAGIASASQYGLLDSYDASNFFEGFDFFTGGDPTHGFVDYIDAVTANTTALAGYSNNQVYLGVDHTTMNPGGGRASVRVSSNKAYTHGLFIADIAHMPGSICGVWPAFWTFGPNWPNSGEIDIIEGVNKQGSDSITLHTSSGCTLSNSGSAAGNSYSTSDCGAGNGNDGCSQSTSNSQNYGNGFNAIGGGVYALEWTSSAISIYFFPRSTIPSDITAGQPNPSSWGTPTAMFSGSGCNIDSHFMNHNIVFDTTFCGDWAGNVFSQTCGNLGSCNNYVAQNPSAFAEAYWLINSIKVYLQGVSSPASAVSNTVASPVAQAAANSVAPAALPLSSVTKVQPSEVAVPAPAVVTYAAPAATAPISTTVTVGGSSPANDYGVTASEFGQPLQESDFGLGKREGGLVPKPFLA